jgi:hypothetical protein
MEEGRGYNADMVEVAGSFRSEMLDEPYRGLTEWITLARSRQTFL